MAKRKPQVESIADPREVLRRLFLTPRDRFDDPPPWLRHVRVPDALSLRGFIDFSYHNDAACRMQRFVAGPPPSPPGYAFRVYEQELSDALGDGVPDTVWTVWVDHEDLSQRDSEEHDRFMIFQGDGDIGAASTESALESLLASMADIVPWCVEERGPGGVLNNFFDRSGTAFVENKPNERTLETLFNAREHAGFSTFDLIYVIGRELHERREPGEVHLRFVRWLRSEGWDL